jgi:hypothetical protein
VEWRDISLARSGPRGYAPSSLPLNETLTANVKRLGKGRMPAIVWIRDRRNRQADALLTENFTDEKLCVALERFLCLRADVKTIPDRRLQEKLRKKAPILVFFDPAGKPVTSLSGRRANSQSAVCSLVGKLWNRSFKLSMKSYVKKKDDILDRLAIVERKKSALLAKLARAEGNPAKLASLKVKIKELEDLMIKVVDDDQKLKDTLELRKVYQKLLPPEAEAG